MSVTRLSTGFSALAATLALTVAGDTGGNGPPSLAGGEPTFVPCVWSDAMNELGEGRSSSLG